MQESVVRTLSSYRKASDFPCGEEPLTGIDIEDLRAIFGVNSEDPMFDVYPVGPEQLPFLTKALGREFDLETYDYFVECHGSQHEPREPSDRGKS